MFIDHGLPSLTLSAFYIPRALWLLQGRDWAGREQRNRAGNSQEFWNSRLGSWAGTGSKVGGCWGAMECWEGQRRDFGELRVMGLSLPALPYSGACKKMCCSWIMFNFIYLLYKICFFLMYNITIYLIVFNGNIWLKAGALLNMLSLLCPSQGNLKDDKTWERTT